MKTVLSACLTLFFVATSACALTPAQQAFIDQLPLSPTLRNTTCGVDMQPLLPKAARWEGRVTDFYDRYIGAPEWEELERTSRRIAEPPSWLSMQYNGESPDLDEPCLREAFPMPAVMARNPQDDPLLAYLKAWYLFETYGCERYEEAKADLMEAAEFRHDDGNGFRAPDSYYRISVMTLKCTGDVEVAYSQYQLAGQHGWQISPPLPMEVPSVPESDFSLVPPTREEVAANRQIAEGNARTRETGLLACWGYRP